MTLVEQAVSSINGWDATRADERGRCVALLESIAQCMQEAQAIWRTHRDDPIELDAKRAVTTLVRPDAAKRLNDLHYQAKDAARKLTDLTGVPLMDAFDLSEEVAIELAYRQLKLGETIPYVCVKAVENQQRRLSALEQALSRLRLS